MMASEKDGGSKTLVYRLLGPILLLVLLGVTAYLRLRNLGYGPIMDDQSVLLNIAMHFVNTGEWPLAANKSSAGIMNPPLIAYLLAIPLFLKPTLTAVHIFQGLMGVAAVAVLAIYAQRVFGWRVALLAALLFAVNPWAVHYSRFIWNPNPIPLFSSLLLMSLLVYFTGKGGPIHLALSFLWLAAIAQLHLSGLALAGAITIIMLLFWSRWRQDNWRRSLAPISVGLAMALLLYWPFILFQQAANFMDLQAIATALVGSSNGAANTSIGVREAQINLAAFLLVQELATGANIWQALSPSAATIRGHGWFIGAAHILFAVSLLYAVLTPLYWQWRRFARKGQQRLLTLPPRETSLVILALWLFVPILLYLRHTVYLQNYYFLYIYPAPFLIVALMVDHALRKLESGSSRLQLAEGIRLPIINLVALSPVIILCGWQFNLHQTWFELLDQKIITPPQQSQHVEEAIATIRLILAENPGCELLILAEGETFGQSSMGVVESFVYPRDVRYLDTRRGYIIPADCAVYMTLTDDAAAVAWLQIDGRLRPEQIVAGREIWRFYELSGERGGDATTILAAWENGLLLTAANVAGTIAPGEWLTLNYTWRLAHAPPTRARYHFFNHFLDETGNLITQDDAPAIDSLYWRTGDQLVTQFYLYLPPELADGRYTLLVGLYTWPDLERVFLTASGETTYLVTEIESP